MPRPRPSQSCSQFGPSCSSGVSCRSPCLGATRRARIAARALCGAHLWGGEGLQTLPRAVSCATPTSQAASRVEQWCCVRRHARQPWSRAQCRVRRRHHKQRRAWSMTSVACGVTRGKESHAVSCATPPISQAASHRAMEPVGGVPCRARRGVAGALRAAWCTWSSALRPNEQALKMAVCSISALVARGNEC